MYVQLEGSFVFKTKANVQLDLYKGQGENITFADISETLNIRVMKPRQSRIDDKRLKKHASKGDIDRVHRIKKSP